MSPVTTGAAAVRELSTLAPAGHRSDFKRELPALPIRIGMGLGLHGIVGPSIWTLEKLGLGLRAIRAFGAYQNRRHRALNPFLTYTPGEQDVFVMTYAKSGTNWTMQIAHQLIHHGRGERDHIHCVVPYPDIEAMPPYMRYYAIPLAEAIDWQSAPERKRVIKTHFDWDMLPYSRDARYIAVIRDPKDVFVSSYFFIKNTVMGPAMPSLDAWFGAFLTEQFPIGGCWAANAAGYWAQRHRPNVLVLSFKQMKRDLSGTVGQIADFLGMEPDQRVLDEVVRQSSFSYMKTIDHKFSPGRIIPWQTDGGMIRKGAHGGSGELLTSGQQQEADGHFRARLKELGSDLPYEEFCELAV